MIHDARPLPHSPEAEMSLLGCLILDPEAVGAALEVVPVDAMYGEANRTIYGAMAGLYVEREDWTHTELVDALKIAGQFEAVGGTHYLSRLSDSVPAATNHPYYARVVLDHYRRRRLIESAWKIAEDARTSTDSVDDIAGHAEATMIAASDGLTSRIVDIPLFAAADNRLRAIGEGVPDTYPTGIDALDEFIGGFPRAGLVTITGVSGHGKSTAIIGIVDRIADTVPVRMFSFEMPADRIAETIIGIRSGVDVRSMARTGGGIEQWASVNAAHGSMTDSRLVIVDDLLDARQILAKCYRYRAQGVGVVVVDYLQNLPQLPGVDNQFQSIVESAQTFQRIARKLGMCVVVVCQGTAEAARRNKPIGLADAYGGIVIQQVTDLGLSIYRPYYATGDGDPAEMQIHVVKNKYGPVTGRDGVRVNFEPTTGQIGRKW